MVRDRGRALCCARVDVEGHLREGVAAWPGIVVDRERFAAEVERRVAAGAELAALKGADLYLAVACTEGDERAIAKVRELLAGEVSYAARKTTATPDQLAEVTARLSRVLFVDEPERPAALRGYSGRGDLRSYLRVVATRELIKVVNRGRREVGLADDDFVDRMVPHDDPELAILRERYRGTVEDALRVAVRGLAERDRALLRYAIAEGLTVDEVGALYGVHRATAARWIAAARERLGELVRTELAARLAITVDEVDSIVRLVQSRIDVSLDRVLRAP